MTIEQNLNHVYYKDDNIHPEAISLRAPGVFKRKYSHQYTWKISTHYNL